MQNGMIINKYKYVQLMHWCCSHHLHMGTARMKLDNETEEEDKQRRENRE